VAAVIRPEIYASSSVLSMLQCFFATASVTGSVVGGVINFKAILSHLPCCYITNAFSLVR